MRGRLIAVAVGALALALAACSNGSSSPQGGSSSSAPALSGELVVWDMISTSQKAWGASLAEMDKQFEAENPGVTIKHVGQPFDSYTNLYRAAFTGGTGPDVAMFLSAGDLLSFKNALMPLDKIVTPEQRANLSGWAAMSENLDESGVPYGIPMALEGNVLIYNKELFAQAGLDPENPPETVAELTAAADQLQAAGITPFGGGDQEGILGAFLVTHMFPAYGTSQDSVDIVNGEIPWTDQRVVDSWNTSKSFYKYLPEDVLSVPYFTDGVNRFLQGKEAIFPGLIQFITGHGDFNFIKALGEENLGVLPPIGVDGMGNYLPTGAQVGWGIPKSSKNVDAAIAYADFITGKESQTLQFTEAGIVPNNKLVDVAAPNSALAQLVQYTKDVPTQIGLHQITIPTVGDVVLAQMQLFFRDEITAEEGLAEVEKKQEQEDMN